MGIFFTLLYIFTSYLAPTTVFGDFAQYRIEVFIALAALIASCLGGSGSALFKMPQTYAVLALIGSVALSLAFNGVLFSVPEAIMLFVSGCIPFFFVVLSIRTRLHIHLLVAVLLVVALFCVAQGAAAVYAGNTTSPWVFMMGGGEGEKFARIRGLGFLNDPNDFCQFLVGLIPCVFFFWRKGNFFRNLLFVLLPVAILVYGMFLTHSRGGMVGLVVALIVLGRRRFGILPALISGALSFIALSAIGWSGGREVSAESGADRTEAWSTGLMLIRTHPVFGVGYLRFTEFYPITAHNTVVVCAAELGIVGFFFWLLMVVPTFYEVTVAARQPATAPKEEPSLRPGSQRALIRPFTKGTTVDSPVPPKPAFQMAFAGPASLQGTPSLAASRPSGFIVPGLNNLYANASKAAQSVPDEEIRRMCGLMLASLSGFFAAGWFLSRAYTTLVFVNIGLAIAVHRLAVERALVPRRLSIPRAAKYAGFTTVALITLIYALLRTLNFLPKG